MKLVNLLIYSVSFLCFLLFLILGDSVAVAIGSVPFLVLVCAAIHEAGHCLGCLLTGSPIREVRLPLMRLHPGGLALNEDLRPVSYCSFRKNRHPWLVYLLGPVFSLLFWGILLGCYLFLPCLALLFGSILSLLVFLVNVIPYRNNDMGQLLRHFKSTGSPAP